ncbi:homing endonuclease [Synechococcus phage S-B43]|jgi:hypothetical protein|nr:homing endonuclease [Synechococcus phage S-B43]
MVGVYCYYKDNQPVYVGCSIDLKRRKSQHRQHGRFLDCTYEVLEETSTTDLYDRERYWINKLDTFNNGYNKVIHNNCDMPEVRKAQSDRMRLNNPMKGRTNSGSFKKGQAPLITEERNEKISNSMKGNTNGKGWAHINSTLTKCPHCGIMCSRGNYARWHGDNCKHKEV